MFKKKENNIFKIATIVLSLALILVLGYVVVDKYNQKQKVLQQQIFQEGYNQAVSDVILKVYQDTQDCKVTNIVLGNRTRNIADAACIQKAINQQIQNK